MECAKRERTFTQTNTDSNIHIGHNGGDWTCVRDTIDDGMVFWLVLVIVGGT